MQFSLTISNVGTKPLFIPNRVLPVDPTAPTRGYLEVEIRNQRGKRMFSRDSEGYASDCGEVRTGRLVLENVLNDYLVLPPGTSYVQQFWLNSHDLKPGTYFVKTNYVASFGPPSLCEKWAQGEVDKLPFQPWFGRVAANEASFIIETQHSKR